MIVLKGFFDGGFEYTETVTSLVDAANIVNEMLSDVCDHVELYADNEYLGNYFLNEGKVEFFLPE